MTTMAGHVTQPPLCNTLLLLLMVSIVNHVSGTSRIARDTNKKDSLMENDRHTNIKFQSYGWNRMLSHLSDSTSVSGRESMSNQEYLRKPCEGHLVKTSQGDICGVERSTTLGGLQDPKFSYVAFQGIPFAQPPVGKLRFKNPVAGLPWKGVRDGSWTVPVCPQVEFNTLNETLPSILGQEDCLYLNVLIPKHDGKNLTNLPVMVFIHGGRFTTGSASSHDPRYFMSKDVIFVHMNYRLGYLGLLSTEDDVAPGNLLLKDQALALHWVQDNIEAFGGDCNKVTLFGESAGSISAHFQMFNPKVKGLFSKVILQSGTSLVNFAVQDDHREVAGLLANHFGCVDKDSGVLYDSQKVVTCLQKVPYEQLVFAVGLFVEWNQLPYRMGFRIHEETIPAHPAKLLKDGHYHMVDLIVGQNSHEGSLLVKSWYAMPHVFDDIAQNFSGVGHLSQLLLPSENHIARKIYNYYMGGVRKYTEKDADALVEMIGDVNFAIPNDIILEFHARDTLYKRNIFAYDFQHRGQYTYMQMIAPHVGQDWVNHGDELQYLFSVSEWFMPLEKKEDFRMRHMLLDLWSNFAKYGNPTPDRSLGFIWQPVSMKKKSHLALNVKPYMEANKRCQVRTFFHSLDLLVNKILYPLRPASVLDINNQYEA